MRKNEVTRLETLHRILGGLDSNLSQRIVDNPQKIRKLIKEKLFIYNANVHVREDVVKMTEDEYVYMVKMIQMV